MRASVSGTVSLEPSPNSWKENLFLSEEIIAERYNTEKKITQMVLKGDYAGIRALLDSMPKGQEYYKDFTVRTANDVERERLHAIIMNSGLRVTVLSTNIPITIIHGIATYFGRVIHEAPADILCSGQLMDVIIKTYCGMVQEFGRKSYSPAAEKIVNYIVSNIAGELSLQQIAEQFHYSTAYVNRILKRETGYSAIQFIKQKRIALAKALLELNEISIEDISYEVGYNNFTYFCRVFRQVENMSPSEYREISFRERNLKDPPF